MGKLKCDLEGDKYVGWFKESKSLPTDSGAGQSELVLKNIHPTDGGTYECKGQTKTRFYTIYVTGKQFSFFFSFGGAKIMLF